MLRRDKAAFALISLLAGALTLSLDVALFVGISIFGFLFIYGWVRRVISESLKIVPFVVFVLSLSAKWLISYYWLGERSVYGAAMAVVEAGLSLVLTLSFYAKHPVVDSAEA